MSIQDELYDRILNQLDITDPPEDPELQEMIHAEIHAKARERFIPVQEQILLGRALFHSFRKLDLLQELLEDPSISEIMVNGPDRIFVEKEGKIFSLDRKFPSLRKLEDVAQQIASASNRIVNEYTPIADARLEDGSRVSIVLPPVSVDGPIITIRKFPGDPMTMEELIRKETLTEEAASFLKTIVAAKYNIFISGGTGAGKTTFLNALSEFIPKEERIITIEDNAELRLLDKPNLVRLESRDRNTEGSGEITIRQLIRASLRMRPDRIIVGEVRGAEAIDMCQALNTGHDGSMSTGHANSPEDMLSRLSTMILMGMEIPLSAIERQLASGIDLILHISRMKDKSRKLLEITEVTGYEDGQIRMNPLFLFREGRLEHVGTLQNVQKLEQEGLDHRGM